ncbi:peptide-methionine (S)-S-oxide reductase MsrA [Geopseudomonas aromaticivorans]|nr:peptide-methionine (S)-S-oxide reductase MsrA [Pseudomonas aromaticivorans]
MSRAIAYPALPDGLRRGLLALLLATSAVTGMPHADAAENSATTDDQAATAIFAGGCFWCMESDFDKVPGVLSTTSGYTGGTLANPSYEQVSAGHSRHVEALLVRFDPTQTSYAKLLDAYWPNIDPLTATGQFCDIGSQYRSAIFYRTPEQQRLAEASKVALQASGRFAKPIVTEILPAGTFYPAEEYHQDYYRKNPLRYYYYRTTCGRDARLQELWGKRP